MTAILRLDDAELDALLAWVREQADEDMRLAEACNDPSSHDPAAAGTWYFSEPHGETVRAEDGSYVACGPWDGDVPANYARHMVRHDPRAELARAEAQRRMLNEVIAPHLHADTPAGRLARAALQRQGWGNRFRPCYREEWGP